MTSRLLASTTALCPACRGEVPAEYVAIGTGVELRTRCPDHGVGRRLVFDDAAYFEDALHIASDRDPHSHRVGLIVEMLSTCNVHCPTCIAASSPEQEGVMDADGLRRLVEDSKPAAVLLSGGEPTIHPGLWEFMDAVNDADVSGRVLISNGVRLGTDRPFQTEFASRMEQPWEVFLQFDSKRPSVLATLRGPELTVRHRERALGFLSEQMIPTTLVCVVEPSLNLDEIGELFDAAKAWPCVVGLQLQPIRLAGRIATTTSRSATLTEVREAVKRDVGVELLQHPESPFAVAAATFDRRERAWRAGPGDDFFIPPTQTPGDLVRLNIMEYSDADNWSALRRDWCPLKIMSHASLPVATDDYFL